MQRSILIGLLLALILVIFSVQNSQVVEIYFLFGKPLNASLSLVLIITLILGIILGYVFSYPWYRKLKQAAEKKKDENTL